MVYSFGNLVEIVANAGEQSVVFTQMLVIDVIDITVQNQMPDESGFAFHTGNFEFLFQNILFIFA